MNASSLQPVPDIAPTPPSNPEIEAALLGAILTNGRTYERVAEFLRPEHFYEPVHGRIFEAAGKLIDQGREASPATLQLVFGKDEALEAAGGGRYLYDLVASTISIINAADYGRLIHDLWKRRELIDICRDTLANAGEHNLDTDAGGILEVLESRLTALSDREQQDTVRSLADSARIAADEIEAACMSGRGITGLSTGLVDLDRRLAGLQNSDLIIIAGRPSMGKSALAAHIALGVAKAKSPDGDAQPVLFYSLEMGHEQITKRLIAAESGIAFECLRNGRLDEYERQHVRDAAKALAAWPLTIDATPAITVQRLRARARRMKRRQGLVLIVVDYLQLMSASPDARRYGNKVQEVSEITGNLKALAKEMNVPVIALSQLSRKVEDRDDKRPQLADLRESGCVAGDTLVVDPCTGLRRRIDEMLGDNPGRVLSTRGYTIAPDAAVRGFCTGTKPVFHLEINTGRKITATANHKFLTQHGWKRLDQLTSDDYIGTPRKITTDRLLDHLSLDELAFLGHMIGDGCALPNHAIQYTCGESELAELVAGMAARIFGDRIKPRISKERNWYQVYLPSALRLARRKRNPVGEWLDAFGLWGKRSHEKFVPEVVFTHSESAIAFFLRNLWATDGHIGFSTGKRRKPSVFYSSSSERLARDVQALLLRLEIVATLRCVPQGAKGRNNWTVNISGQADTRAFLDRIGVLGGHRAAAKTEIENYLDSTTENVNRDIVPFALWEPIARAVIEDRGLRAMDVGQLLGTKFSLESSRNSNFSRKRVQRLADAIDSTELAALANTDMYWDGIKRIEPAGECLVYDLTVPANSNFVANDIIVHNSIEQDADVVGFIFREEYYLEKSEPLAGQFRSDGAFQEACDRWSVRKAAVHNKADILIAKQRNGPCGTVSLYAEMALMRFGNLDKSRQRDA